MSIERISKALLSCLIDKSYSELPSVREKIFDIHHGYEVSKQICKLRFHLGEKLGGIKVGFTNTKIWKQYNVNFPIFAPMYNTTIKNINSKFNINRYLEPKIEPEIYFKLKKFPNSKMSDIELLECCSHFGAGIEIVHSIFKDWKFSAPDAIAAFGLHGEFKQIFEIELSKYSKDMQILLEGLESFSLLLTKDGYQIEKGYASNILGRGPIRSLRSYVSFCESNVRDWLILNKPITTGTITNAYSVKEGEVYAFIFEGIKIDKIKVRI